MAIDTRAKRASVMGMGSPIPVMLPFPDGTIDQGDRQHFLELYSGILVAALVSTGEHGCALSLMPGHGAVLGLRPAHGVALSVVERHGAALRVGG